MTYMANAYKGTKCDIVTERLKDMIITGTYKSGEKLPNEAALCEMFGVSRITIREAMKKLSMMGLLDIRQGKGTFVKSVDLGLFMKPLFQLVEYSEINIEAIYTARELIESDIAALAAVNRTQEDITRMETVLQNIRYCFQQGDLEGCYQCDVEFHMALAKAAGNPILLATMEVLQDIDDACVKRYDKYLVGYEGSNKEHQDVLDAVMKQDPKLAQEAMGIHARNSKTTLLK